MRRYIRHVFLLFFRYDASAADILRAAAMPRRRLRRLRCFYAMLLPTMPMASALLRCGETDDYAARSRARRC